METLSEWALNPNGPICSAIISIILGSLLLPKKKVNTGEPTMEQTTVNFYENTVINIYGSHSASVHKSKNNSPEEIYIIALLFIGLAWQYVQNGDKVLLFFMEWFIHLFVISIIIGTIVYKIHRYGFIFTLGDKFIKPLIGLFISICFLKEAFIIQQDNFFQNSNDLNLIDWLNELGFKGIVYACTQALGVVCIVLTGLFSFGSFIHYLCAVNTNSLEYKNKFWNRLFKLTNRFKRQINIFYLGLISYLLLSGVVALFLIWCKSSIQSLMQFQK